VAIVRKILNFLMHIVISQSERVYSGFLSNILQTHALFSEYEHGYDSAVCFTSVIDASFDLSSNIM